MLAGVSVDYYTRLERGNIHGASESVLDAIARALQLGGALFAPIFETDKPNLARFIFLDSRAKDFYADCLDIIVVVCRFSVSVTSACGRELGIPNLSHGVCTTVCLTDGFIS
jgi:transcriptional regulator with XRE-family HTH domain